MIIKDAKVYLGEKDISGDLNTVALSYEAEMQDDTAMGDDTRSNKPGLTNVGVAMEGFVESDDAIEDLLWDKFTVAGEVLTVAPETGAAGETAFSFKSLIATYTPGGTVGDLLSFSSDANGTGSLYKGTVMETGAKTVTANGTARQLGAAAAGQKVYASLHVLAVSGTNPTLDVIVQSDDASGFAAPTARITFGQMSDIGAELLTLDGPITDDWWRVRFEIGGTGDPSFTFLVVVGIL